MLCTCTIISTSIITVIPTCASSRCWRRVENPGCRVEPGPQGGALLHGWKGVGVRGPGLQDGARQQIGCSWVFPFPSSLSLQMTLWSLTAASFLRSIAGGPASWSVSPGLTLVWLPASPASAEAPPRAESTRIRISLAEHKEAASFLLSPSVYGSCKLLMYNMKQNKIIQIKIYRYLHSTKVVLLIILFVAVE